MSTSLITAAAESGSSSLPSSWAIGATVLVILLAAMLALLVLGKGRPHA
jgi:hypothetical protein